MPRSCAAAEHDDRGEWCQDDDTNRHVTVRSRVALSARTARAALPTLPPSVPDWRGGRMRAAAGEVISARAEDDQEALHRASRGDGAGIVTRSGGLQPLPRHPAALVRRDGGTSAAPRRGAHRRRPPLPRRTRLLVAAVGAVVAVAGTSTVALMSDHGAPPPTVNGQARTETPRLDVPMAGPFAPADEAEQQMVNPDEPTALHRLAAAAPLRRHSAAMPRQQTGPTRSPDPSPVHRSTREPEPTEDAEPRRDAEPTQDADGTPPRKSKGAESRGNGDPDRGSDGRSGGAGRRGE
jgi:hypothetical protein